MKFEFVNAVDLEVASCVYKLYCGDRFLIVKGKTLAGSIYLIEKGYAAFIAAGGGTGNKQGGDGQKESDGVNTYYRAFYTYWKKNPDLPLYYKVMLESDNPYELLKCEQELLDESINNKRCLNNNIKAYIPIFRKKTQMYGWMNKGSVLAFKKYLKNAK